MSAFHRRIIRRIKELRAEGEEARASRLEKALAHVDEVLSDVYLSEAEP